MIHTIKLLAIAIIFSSLSSCTKEDAPADPNITFKATLNGANERPTPNTSTGTGTSTLIFNNDTKIFTVTTTYSGLTGAPTGSHVHKGDVTIAGPIIFNFGTTLATPIVFTSAAIDAASETDLKAGLWYTNVHTAAFLGGEIRGQLIKQ